MRSLLPGAHSLCFVILFSNIIRLSGSSSAHEEQHDRRGEASSRHLQGTPGDFLRLQILMDSFPQEVGWKLEVLDDFPGADKSPVVLDTVANVTPGSYGNISQNILVEEEIALIRPSQLPDTPWPPVTVIYRFTILDSYGDGLIYGRYSLSYWQRGTDGSVTRGVRDTTDYWQRLRNDDTDGISFHDYSASTILSISRWGVEEMLPPLPFLMPAPPSPPERDPTPPSPTVTPATTSPSLSPLSSTTTTTIPTTTTSAPSFRNPFLTVRVTPNVFPFRKFYWNLESHNRTKRLTYGDYGYLDAKEATEPPCLSSEMSLGWGKDLFSLPYEVRMLQAPEAFGMFFGGRLLEISHYELSFTNRAGEETIIAQGTELVNNEILFIAVEEDGNSAYLQSQEPSMAPSLAPSVAPSSEPRATTIGCSTTSGGGSDKTQYSIHFVWWLLLLPSVFLTLW